MFCPFFCFFFVKCEVIGIICFCMFQHFAHLSPGEFMLVRQTLLNFFQDMHIRVSASCFQSKCNSVFSMETKKIENLQGNISKQ